LIFALGVYILGCREESITEVSKRSPRDWGGRALVSVGLFSYSLYLVHVPMEKVVWHYVVEPLGLSLTAAFFMLTIAGVGAALALAWGVHLLIERPSMGWSRQIRTDK
jgi:peptidoglycan/LPS O-acetylase OafA/YrhL